MSTLFWLFCLVHGDPVDHAFPIRVSGDTTIGALKNLIKAANSNRFCDIAADKLKLWREITHRDDLAYLDTNLVVQNDEAILSPFSVISETFPDGIADEHVHIIVSRPDTVSVKK